MPTVTGVGLTSDPYVNGILDDFRWAVQSFTFSFPTSGSFYGSSYGTGENANNFGTLNAQQQAVARAVLASYAAVANVTFTEITETSSQHADLRFALTDATSTAHAYFPNPAAEGGDVWFRNTGGTYANPVRGNYAYATFLHETGHALGLDHAHDGIAAMPIDRDSVEYTVMSYRSYEGGSLTGGYVNETWGFSQSLMMYDIAALQYLYGGNFSTNSGGTTYSWSPTTGEMFVNGVRQGAPGSNRIFLTIWDGGGNDTYDMSNYSNAVSINLNPGLWSITSQEQLADLDQFNPGHLARGNVFNALQFGSDMRSLIENAIGGSGDDTIIGNQIGNGLLGGGGNDLLGGGAGNDHLRGESGDDAIDGGAGNDVLDGGDGNDYIVGELDGDHITGGDGNDKLLGGDAGDIIEGGSGDDLLGGGAGWDLMEGGSGNDGLDGGVGTDRLFGGDGNDTLVGELDADVLEGGSGNDTLLGGAEGDILRGQDGDDLLGGGVGWDLMEGGSGNDGLDGGSGNDTLRGGDGNDRLVGDVGNDNLFGEFGADTFVFQSQGGTDTIRDFQIDVDHIQNLSGILTADVIATAVVTDGGSTIIHIGDETYMVIAGVTGISNDWFV